MSFLRDPKRLVATILAGVAGLFVLLDSSGQVPLLEFVASTLLNWVALLAAVALLVGFLSVVSSHIRRLARRENEWVYSFLLILSMAAVIISGTLIGYATTPDGAPGYTVFPRTLGEQPVRDLFRAIYQPLASSFLALLTFFSLSAVLRAVRKRTAEALVITFVAMVVLVASALPTGAIPFLGEGTRLMADYLAIAGARALLIGASLGAVVAGVRVLLGFDQPFLDR
jgi:quinol-cytochrome oxidoreductase complex cytochrome b subunit